MYSEGDSYAGIGSRQMSPTERRQLITDLTQIRQLLARYKLNSGGADGTDTVFEEIHCGEADIYLPYKGFNGHKSKLYNITPEAITLAKYYHPLGEALSGPSLKFMARNGYQVLGYDLKTPVKFVACFTNSPLVGGTSQALRIAKDHNIPIFNLIDPSECVLLTEFLQHEQNKRQSV